LECEIIMRSVSAAFSAAIALGTVRMCELYDCERADGTHIRVTNHDKDIIWDAAGNTYTSIPSLNRGPIRFNSDGRYDECEVSLGIQGTDFLTSIHANILESAKITHKRIRWDASYAADEEYTLNIWRPDLNYNASGLSFRLLSLMDSLNIQVPAATYQEPCNHFLFDTSCGLTRASYAYTGTATAGTTTTLTDANAGTLYKVNFDAGDSGNPIAIGETITGGDNGYTAVVVQIVYLTSTTGTIWYVELSNSNNFNDDETLTAGADTVDVNGTPAEDTSFYEQGELEMTSGNNSGESRPVLSSSGSVRTVLWPFPNAIAAADTYKIYPGCDFRPATCDARFNNKTNWRGFPYGPQLEETIM
jgi:hypothetical protein